jgi:hypothetical protein
MVKPFVLHEDRRIYLKIMLRSPDKKLLAGIITLFSMLLPICLWKSYSKYGASFIQHSLLNIWHDPIYLYAVIDLAVVFTLVSYWVWKETKAAQKSFWFWPLLFSALVHRV